jgi:hypothetical protein
MSIGSLSNCYFIIILFVININPNRTIKANKVIHISIRFKLEDYWSTITGRILIIGYTHHCYYFGVSITLCRW